MSNFKIGQKVVCVNDSDRICRVTGLELPHPSKDDIVTIKNKITFRGVNYLLFENYDLNGYEDYNFRPLDHAFADEVIKMICEEPETVEV